MLNAWRYASWLGLAISAMAVIRQGHDAGGDTRLYVKGADALLGDGSYGSVPYPPGFPALLAPFRALELPVGLVAVGSSLALVTLVWWLAVRLGGPVAGAFSGVIIALSPLFPRYGALVMSDAPAAAAVVAALIAVTAGRFRLAGLLAAASAWMRLSHALFVVALPTRRSIAAMVVAMLPLAVFNVAVYGSVSGYPAGAAEFSHSYLTGDVWLEVVGEVVSPYTNLYLWPAILFGRFGLLVPLLPVFAAAEIWMRRQEPAARMAAVLVAVNVTTHWFYFFQSARFILPSAALLVAFAAAFAGRVASRLVDHTARPDSDARDRLQPGGDEGAAAEGGHRSQ